MKLFVLFLLLTSQNILACRLHKFEFLVENKSVVKTDNYNLKDLKKENDKWVINLKLSKKTIQRLNVATKKNTGKNLNILFDKRPVASYPITSELPLSNDEFVLTASLADEEATSLKQDCANH